MCNEKYPVAFNLNECLKKEFQNLMLEWYSRNGRKFYWRDNSLSPWQWLVLELLLKRTRAESVEKFFPSFIEKYATPKIVVSIKNSELEKDLKFLGLQHQRSVSLKKIANIIMTSHNGHIPMNEEALLSLPFVGRYVANAVLCFSKNMKKPIVDINVARVLTRFIGFEMPKDLREEWLWELAKKMLPANNFTKYNFALLDLGAIYCRNKPKCIECCLRNICKFKLLLN